MQIETKFLRLKGPVTIGSYFGDWRVTWLGGWTRHRLSYIVMVASGGQHKAIGRVNHSSGGVLCGPLGFGRARKSLGELLHRRANNRERA